MSKPVRLRRSALYIPGSNARALEKARGLPADALILDLEDAVAPQAKTDARAAVVAAAHSGAYGHREVVIRVNAADSPWAGEDLAGAARSGATAVLLPKVEGPEDVAFAGRTLRSAGAPEDMGLWVMAETPAAIRNIDRVVTAEPALQVIVMGNNDLGKALRLPADPLRQGLVHALSTCIIAARAQGLDILDGVFVDLADEAGFARECLQGRELGFDGKTLIHPRQIEPANEVFGINAEDLAWARAVVAAWETAAAAGQGVAVLEGQMIEALHADAARRLLALHAAIEARARD
jgi:citrate lyase subunit beta/citryl-CoA lyase